MTKEDEGNTNNILGQNAHFLPAPVQLSPADGAKFATYPRTTTLKWSEIRGAISYAVEVDYCQSSQNPIECRNPAPWVFSAGPGKRSPSPNTVKDTTFIFDFVGAQPGRWRVSAIDKNGQKGSKSPW